MSFCKFIRTRVVFESVFYLFIFLGVTSWPGISIGGPETTEAFLDVHTILDGWEAHYGSILTMKVRCSECVPETSNPDTGSLVRNSHVERIQDGKLYYIRYSKAEQGFAIKNSVVERSFDGTVSKEYLPMEKTGRITPGLTGSNLDTMNLFETYMMMQRYYLNNEDYPNGIPYLSMMLRDRMKYGQVRVLPELETVSGELCHVVEAIRGNDIRKFWIAHGKDMLPMKFELTRDNKVLNKMEVLKVTSTVTDMGEFWYPSEAYRELSIPKVGTVKYEFRTQEFVPHVRISSDAFDIDFPDGTRIRDKVAGITYVKGGSDNVRQAKLSGLQTSAPIKVEPNLPESSDEVESPILTVSAVTEPNALNDQSVVQHEESTHQGLPEQRRKCGLVVYSLLGIMILAMLSVWLLHYRYRIL